MKVHLYISGASVIHSLEFYYCSVGYSSQGVDSYSYYIICIHMYVSVIYILYEYKDSNTMSFNLSIFHRIVSSVQFFQETLTLGFFPPAIPKQRT